MKTITLEEVEKILDKYYVLPREDGSYDYDPSGNQLIDAIRQDLLTTTSKDTN